VLLQSSRGSSAKGRAALSGVDGILVPGGFGIAAWRQIDAIRYARERGVPTRLQDCKPR
jgi:CTP synthase (UTP-ammonia lyase)